MKVTSKTGQWANAAFMILATVAILADVTGTIWARTFAEAMALLLGFEVASFWIINLTIERDAAREQLWAEWDRHPRRMSRTFSIGGIREREAAIPQLGDVHPDA